MRENLMSGSMWQGMETRAFRPRRHPLTLPADSPLRSLGSPLNRGVIRHVRQVWTSPVKGRKEGHDA
jgi:hypothetical protein